MTSTSTRTTLASLLLLIIIATLAAAEDTSPALRRGLFSLTPKTHLIIINSLTTGQKLTIRCWSDDDDLGIHVIDVGAKYEVVFHPNIFWTTRFVCELAWDHGFLHFDAYRGGRDKKRCGKVCQWVASMSSVISDGVQHIEYPWQGLPAPPPPAII